MNQNAEYVNIVFAKIKSLLKDGELYDRNLDCLQDELCKLLTNDSSELYQKAVEENQNLRLALKHVVKLI